jgi:hypothetical protein
MVHFHFKDGILAQFFDRKLTNQKSRIQKSYLQKSCLQEYWVHTLAPDMG